MQFGGKSICIEVDETSKVIQQKSALHVSDNRYYVYCNCRQENNIKKRCGCGDSLPNNLCGWCNERQA